ncbi:MAG TPA: DUF2946 family protein [Burkholderiaceae bacterium]|nr:DUF2946 family protein [Burkholderiaceae bacterium]
MRMKHVTRGAIGQRIGVLAFVVSLVLAPALANIWPAFGKGEMLYVADAPSLDHSAHAGHHHPGTDKAQRPPHDHKAHCALCVLAFLGWAPPADLSISSGSTAVANLPAALPEDRPRSAPIWSGAHARAPPISA